MFLNTVNNTSEIFRIKKILLWMYLMNNYIEIRENKLKYRGKNNSHLAGRTHG